MRTLFSPPTLNLPAPTRASITDDDDGARVAADRPFFPTHGARMRSLQANDIPAARDDGGGEVAGRGIIITSRTG